jgi:hypothetical protein
MITQCRSLVSEIRYFRSFDGSFGLGFGVYMCQISVFCWFSIYKKYES